MIKVWMILTAGCVVFGGPITYTYQYTGNALSCSFGSCPSNIGSDYVTASVTTSAQIPPLLRPNLLVSPFNSILLSWSFGDSLDYVALSSTDTNAATELTFLALNGSGTAWNIGAANHSVNIFNPSISPPLTDHLQANGWQAAQSNPGQWTVAINGEQGGTTTAPTFVTTSEGVSALSGRISGAGAEDYYSFYWARLPGTPLKVSDPRPS